MKKKLKKVKTRMNQRAKEFELQLANSDSKDRSLFERSSENKSKIQKNLKEINKLISAPSSGTWPENKVSVLDRSLGELDRMFAKTVNIKQLESAGDADRNCFREQSGFAVICRVLLLANENFQKSIVTLPAK
ncbi:S phase cyclin A-associated protein in the endoplasmic reticulum-like [Convolutriloba macropyga]|uniref:S phase cyclin A-associated protein in the endoplasmic reticulum-like n=1 Tax=Convolutriloba macropyga TaxID=536237 RepID=UPI003F51EF92